MISVITTVLPIAVALFFLLDIGKTIITAISLSILAGSSANTLFFLVLLVMVFCGFMLILEKVHEMIKSSVSLRESIEQGILRKMYDAQRSSEGETKESSV